MAENIRIEVVTPEHEVINEDAQIVMAPGSMGEFGVLSGHTPFMTSLKIGEVCYNDADGNRQCVCVNSGVAEALPDKVTILTE
ncbi:MAG: ATP synthase F1 subunit epsilon, partial [Deltaproteobacteria bacterium]|nr:ATP synthase F1 subunit epsilon [Deltaproteobacteria bacterium]